MANFGGGGGFNPMPDGRQLELLARAKLADLDLKRGRRNYRPPKRPRFGLLRRIMRAIRGGGD